MQVLKEKGILIGSHIQKSRTIEDIPFSENIEELQKQMERVNTIDFAVLDVGNCCRYESDDRKRQMKATVWAVFWKLYSERSGLVWENHSSIRWKAH